MMLNGVIAALVAITAACGFVAPWAAIVIGLVAGVIAVIGVLAVERIGSTTRLAPSPSTGCPVSGERSPPASSRYPRWPTTSRPVPVALSTREASTNSESRRLGSSQSAVHLRSVVPRTLGDEEDVRHSRRREVETAGLDVSEHGMWGYPEFYIPVPGGYGTESHGHLGHATHAGRPLSRSGCGAPAVRAPRLRTRVSDSTG